MAKTVATRLVGTGRVGSIQKTVDLPASDGTAAVLDCSARAVLKFSAYISAAFMWCLAASASAAATALDSDDSRANWPSGFYEFEVANVGDNNIYLRSQGVAVIDGLSYSTVEEN